MSDVQVVELLPCPFCGVRGDVKLDRTSNGMWRVLCNNCGASSFKSAIKNNTVSSWNERATPSPVGASVPSESVLYAMQICTNYSMPLGITYAEYNKARDMVNEWLAQQRGQG